MLLCLGVTDNLLIINLVTPTGKTSQCKCLEKQICTTQSWTMTTTYYVMIT